MRSGIYALASRDGAPVTADDLGILGLEMNAVSSPAFAAMALDGELQGRAASKVILGTMHLFFLGHIDEPEVLAAALQLSADASPATLALGALHKWGPENAMAHLPGEWSLLSWDSANGSLLAGVSQRLRDRMFFTSNGRCVAIAPHVLHLGRLPWVGQDYDSLGMPLSASRLFLREPFLQDRTILRGVTAIEPGTFRLFTSAGPLKTFAAPPRPEPVLWESSFDEAVAALETTLRQIIRETLARHGTVALMLRGGLDSSVLAWIAAEERRPGQTLICLTSAAPLGSGIADEREQAELVARTFDLPIEFVVPDDDVDPYRFSEAMLAEADGLASSGKEYLFDALYAAAKTNGADAIMSGVLGEMTITRPETLFTPKAWLKNRVRTIRETLKERRDEPDWPDAGFFVRFSRDVLDQLPAEIHRRRRTWPPNKLLRPGDRLGYSAAYDMIKRFTTAAPAAGLRRLSPFRDPRLHILMAGMPASFTVQGGMRRAVVRAMMKGHVPDAIRLRQDKGPFSPPHLKRLQHYAERTLMRIDDYRRSQAAAWIDLDWLQHELAKISRNGIETVAGHQKIQSTALAAEVFQYWSTQGYPA